MIALEKITAGYGKKPVLDNVDLRVARGEHVGLIGPNGCGKTTLLRVVSGILPPRSGSVRLAGRDQKTFTRRELARKVACLPQESFLGFDFTVAEMVLMGRSPHVSRCGKESDRDRHVVRLAMQQARIDHLADRPVTQLSGGERQRVGLAMCLAQEPEVLLLDEPVSHLDLGQQLSVMTLISDLNRTQGITVLSVLHDLHWAAEYCQRLLVLDKGRVVALGTTQEVLTSEMVARVYGTTVLVQRNPLSGRPHIVLAAAPTGIPSPSRSEVSPAGSRDT